MLKVLTSQQMNDIDKKATEDFNIPVAVLMENAGRAVFDQIKRIIEQHNIPNPSVVVICGNGNNGGDGFVCARHLLKNSINTTVLTLNDSSKIKSDALINHYILENLVEILDISKAEEDHICSLINQADIVVDAILGTGLNKKLQDSAKKAVELINACSSGVVVSIDIPTGVNSDDAKVMGDSVCADYTVCFETPKVGNILNPGFQLNGHLIISEISIPNSLIYENSQHNINLLTPEYVSSVFPQRQADGNKSTFGKVFNIVGSKSLPGAGYLAGISSLKSGAGYSTICCPDSMVPTYSVISPDLVYKSYDDSNKGYICAGNADLVAKTAFGSDVILLGCGLGHSQETVDFVQVFLEKLQNTESSLIIDADGLNCLASLKNYNLPENTILTPHPVELARLLKIDLEKVLSNKINIAIETAQIFKSIVVLKMADTIIAEPNGNVFINSTGNSALATAGTGDVLSGMIGGFLAQTKNPLIAAQLGVFLHGMAGDIYLEQNNEYSLTASALVDFIAPSIRNITKNNVGE